jgi:hypothetical protein
MAKAASRFRNFFEKHKVSRLSRFRKSRCPVQSLDVARAYRPPLAALYATDASPLGSDHFRGRVDDIGVAVLFEPDNPSSLAVHMSFDFKCSFVAELADPAGCLSAVGRAGVRGFVARRKQPATRQWQTRGDRNHRQQPPHAMDLLQLISHPILRREKGGKYRDTLDTPLRQFCRIQARFHGVCATAWAHRPVSR